MGRETSLLIVEDNDDDALLAERALLGDSARPPRFTRARSLNEAIRIARAEAFDAALLDLALPDSDGVDTLRGFLDALGGDAPPVVVLSGASTESLTTETVQLGAQDYVLKDRMGGGVLARSVRHSRERHRMARELQDATDRAHFLANHCPLTGLPNRHLFQDRLAHAITTSHRQRQRLALLFIDVDGFKPVNDDHGHDVGDALLCTLSRRLEGALRSSDTIARIGGDEFVAVLSDVGSTTNAARVAEKIGEMVREPVSVNGIALQVTASVGIALYPDDASDADSLLKRADTAMYRAKNERDAFACYEPDLEIETQRRISLERDLRSALERDEFVLHLQPLVAARDARIVGAEALIRWQHPTRGLLAPLEFIPVAEETSLIHEIGNWVIAEACRILTRFGERGLPGVPISVNLSSRQFEHADFIHRIEAALASLPPESAGLCLELTESYLAADLEAANETLRRIRALGVRIAIDDFGTGFSSLAALRVLPLDALKLDRCFVRELPGSTRDGQIVSSVTALAGGLGLDVVAEGVETEEQRDFLAEHGCGILQGFLFARPEPVDAFERRLKEGRVADPKPS